MGAIEIRESDTRLELTFAAFESGNSMSLDSARELVKITRKFSSWRLPVVVRSQHPRLFCSGGNLSDYKKLRTKAAGLKVNREIERALDRFAAWRAPKLAVVSGDVLGGGIEWLSCFDFRWSTPAPLFVFWQRRLGLSTGWGGGRRWSNSLREEQLRRLLLESQVFGAERALELGLIDRVISEWKIEDEIETWCERMASPTVAPLMRWSIKNERRLFSTLWLGRLHREILSRWK